MSKLDIINKILEGSSSKLREKYFIDNYSTIYTEIINFCVNINELPFKQKLWHWVNDYPNFFICNCGNKTTFNKNWLDGYRLYCSPKCAQNNNISKEKRIKTNLEKYGVDNIAKLESIKEKTKQTNLDKYGTKSTFQNKDVQYKWRETILNRYGAEHYFKTDEFKTKSKKKSLVKWGTEHFVQSKFYSDKLNDINFSEKLRTLYIKKHIDKYLEYNLDFKEIKGRIITLKSNICNHEFSIHYDSLMRRIENNYEYCTICNPTNSGQSQEEKVLIEWLQSLNIDLIEKDRSLGIELDIYLPKYNLAIEYNGLYWHSELYKNKLYHLNKTEICFKNNIQLIHIWEDDWLYKKDIVKSIILNRLKLTYNTVFARKCQIKLINSKIKDEFLENNHIQGKCVSSINIGLFSNEELVSLMTFGKRSINSKLEVELLRFCNIKYTSVIGAASKLFNYFIKNNQFDIIYSYADISQFTGNLYSKLKFKYLHRSKPNYWWVVDGIRHHRFNYNKQKLIKEGFDSNKTEVNIMYERGYYRLFGCGQDKYIYYK
jgi:hypothetical protein